MLKELGHNTNNSIFVGNGVESYAYSWFCAIRANLVTLGKRLLIFSFPFYIKK